MKSDETDEKKRKFCFGSYGTFINDKDCLYCRHQQGCQGYLEAEFSARKQMLALLAEAEKIAPVPSKSKS